MRSRDSLSDDRSPAIPIDTRLQQTEDHMADITLNILKPSVNNLTVRIFMRAADLTCDEVDVWGRKDEPEFFARIPRS